MNLIVTTPKSQIKISNQELKEVQLYGGYFFRVFRFKPKVNVGERIYEIENGVIVGYGIIIDVSQIYGSMECSTTGRDWGNEGDWVVKYDNWKDLSQLVRMKGIQGIRYTQEMYN